MRHAHVRINIESPQAVSSVLYALAPGVTRPGLADRLLTLGYRSTVAADAADVMRQLAERTFDLCLIDLAGGRGPLTTVRLVRARHAGLPVAGVLDPGASAVATEAIHAGLVDLLTWPFDALELAALLADVRERAPAGLRSTSPGEIVAFSAAMRDVWRQVRSAADTRQTICLTGSRGTGKTLVARALHQASPERTGPCVVVDCAHQSASALDMTLFGESVALPAHATGVEAISDGSALAHARGGTLVIGHIDEAPARVQLRIMAILRDREVVVGMSDRPMDLNVRVVMTMSTAEARYDAPPLLRPELSARFAVHIDLPPLRRRREDVPMLAARLLDQRARAGARAMRFSRAALEVLSALPWPGNVPELEHVVDLVFSDTRRAVVQVEDVLRHVSLDGGPRPGKSSGLREAREQFEREWIEDALTRHQGRVGEAARALGIQRTNLYRKVRQLGISRALLSSQR